MASDRALVDGLLRAYHSVLAHRHSSIKLSLTPCREKEVEIREIL